MGYAEIAGLPAYYGLYGSIFPILAFSLITTSPQFIVAVDAAPAALVGASIIPLHIAEGTSEAVTVISLITFFTSLWLLLFYFFNLGKLLNFISAPAMAGFISGVGTTIITMQIPKLFGESASHGEFLELAFHLIESFKHIHYLSLLMGGTALIILLVSRKLIPRFPMSIVIMVIGALSTIFFHVDNYGVPLLADVQRGLPKLVLPNFKALHYNDALMLSLPVAIVILAESLLADSNFANKNKYKIDKSTEILGFSVANFASSLVGCCPINGSVSISLLSEQYGGKSKFVSYTAGITMIFIVCFATGFIKYLPVPVLTAIIISALLGMLEFDVAAKLYKMKKSEFLIFVGSFIAVLVLGTIYGVAIGLLLSFVEAILEASNPPTSYLGVVPGKNRFYRINKHRNACEINGVVIFRFIGNLFFANIETFVNGIEKGIKPDTKIVIVDAGGITSLDFTAAEQLEALVENLNSQGIKLYITEHQSSLNRDLRKFGLTSFIEEGIVRRTISLALMTEGIYYPYVEVNNDTDHESALQESLLVEFDWAFGDDAEEQLEKIAMDIIHSIEDYKSNIKPNIDEAVKAAKWKNLGEFDEDKLYEHLEIHLIEIAKALGQTPEQVEAKIAKRRLKLDSKMQRANTDFYNNYINKRREFEHVLKENNSEIYDNIMEYRKKQYDRVKDDNPDLANHIKAWLEN